MSKKPKIKKEEKKKQTKVKESRVIWSRQDDAHILSDLSISELSTMLLRSKASIKQRRSYLKAKAKKDQEASMRVLQNLAKSTIPSEEKITIEELNRKEESLLEELRGYTEQMQRNNASTEHKAIEFVNSEILEVKEEELVPKKSILTKVKEFFLKHWNS